MDKRKVVRDNSGNLTLVSDDDCRLNYNFRASPVIARGLLVLSDRLAALSNERKEAAEALLKVSHSTKAEAKRLIPWMQALSAEARRTKARRAMKNKAPSTEEVGRETCSVRSCYAYEFRDGYCQAHYEKRGGMKLPENSGYGSNGKGNGHHVLRK